MTIISHKFKFIFIKTAKTAGTSIELALETICGPDDICAPITQKKQLREEERGYIARNHRGVFVPRLRRPEGMRPRFRSEIKELFRRQKFKAHMPATDVCWRLGSSTWDEYTRISVERNPWDKAVSAYFWHRRHMEKEIPFEDWVTVGFQGGRLNFLKHKGEVAITRMIRYERLNDDFRSILLELGVEKPTVLPGAKSAFRPKRATYQKAHTESTRDSIAEVCAEEIEYFGYSFGNPEPTSAWIPEKVKT